MNNVERIQMLFQDINGINHFHDSVWEATNISYTDDELEKIFKMLPESIQSLAFEWTMADTEFGDAALRFFKSAPINIRRSRESLIQR